MTDVLEAFLDEFSQRLDEMYRNQPAFTERPYRAHGSHVIVGGSDPIETAEQERATPPAREPVGV